MVRPPSRRAPRRPNAAGSLPVVALIALIALVALGAPGRPAGAHATLQDTSPADDALVDAVPDEVVLRFDEPVTAPTGSVQVISPSGSRVDRTASTRDDGRAVAVAVDGDAVGTYTVAFRVVSDDGHTITGSSVFHVETRTGAASVDHTVPVATSAAGGIGRWLGYAGAFLAVGGAGLLLALARRGGAGPAGPRLRALVALGAGAGAVGTALAVVAQTATTTGRGLAGATSLVLDLAADSRPVGLALARAVVLALAAVVAVVGWRRRATPLVVAAGALALAGTLLAPIAGHPWTADRRALAVASDGLHLLGASAWLGLVAAVAAVADRLPDPRPAIGVVSRAAAVAVAAVGITGGVSGWLLLGSTDALFQTASGQLVLLKAIGFGTVAVLGWINRSRLVPLLAALVTPRPAAARAEAGDGAEDEDGAEEGDGDDRATARLALRRLVQVMRMEVVVAALVLAATAALVNQPPGRDQLAEPFTQTTTVDGLAILLEVDPARAGPNEVHVYVTDASGRPASIDAIEITAARPGIPERRLTVEQITADHAVVLDGSLPTPGTWTIEVTTVREGVPRQHVYEVPIR